MKTYVAPTTDKQELLWQSSICVSGGSGGGGSQGSGAEDNTQNPTTPGFDGIPPQG